MISIFDRFLKDELSSNDIYHWAEALAGRSTIGYENKYDKLLYSILMNIITDHSTGINLTKQQAEIYLNQLQKTF